MDRKTSIKVYSWLSVGLALLGSAFMEARIRSQQGDLGSPLVVMSVGAIGVLVSEILKRKTTAREVLEEDRKARDEWLRRGVLADVNIAFFVFASGIVVEFLSFDQPEYQIIAVGAYFIVSSFVYFAKRRSIPTFQWDFIFHFALVFALPVVAVAWKRPEFLGQVYVSQIQTTRELLLLTFFYVQAGLMLSTAMLASRSWRTSLLMKRGLSVKSLQGVQADLLSKIQDGQRRDLFREAVSDLAILRESLICGQFQTSVAWGWSVIDRILSISSHRRTMKEKAEELGLLTSDFEKCYEIRNNTVHKGYRPTFDDAFDCVQLLRTIMIELSKREAENRPSLL